MSQPTVLGALQSKYFKMGIDKRMMRIYIYFLPNIKITVNGD